MESSLQRRVFNSTHCFWLGRLPWSCGMAYPALSRHCGADTRHTHGCSLARGGVVATMLGIGALFLVAALVLYVPSQNIILLMLTLCGAAFGFLWRQGRSTSYVPAKPSRLGGLLAGVFALALMLLSLWGAGTV